MPLNVHDASVGVFVRGVTSLKVILTKGEAHAAATGRAPAELYGRVDATLAYLTTVDDAALETGLARTIEIAHRGASTRYTGTQFRQQFAVPSSFFHRGAIRQRLRFRPAIDGTGTHASHPSRSAPVSARIVTFGSWIRIAAYPSKWGMVKKAVGLAASAASFAARSVTPTATIGPLGGVSFP
jgi:hypothetical protein